MTGGVEIGGLVIESTEVVDSLMARDGLIGGTEEELNQRLLSARA